MLDVRLILDGKVWPRDPHDFVGCVVDILDEQLADADAATRLDAARQLLGLLGEPNLVIRSFAVLALRRAMNILGEASVREAVAAYRGSLDTAPAPIWQLSQPTLLAEAEFRLTHS